MHTNHGSTAPILLVVALVIVTGCSTSTPPTQPPSGVGLQVTNGSGVNLNPDSMTSVAVNGDQLFIATVTDDPSNAGVTWGLSGTGCPGAACGTLSATSSASGVAITYTAPAAVRDGISVTATSVTDPTQTIALGIYLYSPVQVRVTPTNDFAMRVNAVQQFTATLTNDDSNAGVTWTVTGAGCAGSTCGTLSATSSASGVPVNYTAPAVVPNPATVEVRATSVTDFRVFDSDTVALQP